MNAVASKGLPLFHPCYDVLQRAQRAAQLEDWSSLVQHLQVLLGKHPDYDYPDRLSAELRVAIADQALTLALQGLESGDFQSRWELMKVFPSFGEAAIAPLVDLLYRSTVEWETQWFAIRILGDLHYPAVPVALVKAFLFYQQDAERDEDGDLRQAVREALMQQGNTAIVPLLALLDHADTRFIAVQVLTHIRTRETIAPLLSVVSDADPTIRAIAVEALSSFQDKAIPPVLMHALGDLSSTVRRAAVEGLGLRPEWAESYHLVDVLSHYLGDLSLEVCQQAAIALGRLQQPTAIPALIQCLSAPATPESLQLTIVRAIAWIPAQQALEALGQLLLEANLASRLSLAVHTEIATVLGQVQDFKACAAAIATQALQSEHPWLTSVAIRQALILSVGQLGQPETISGLIEYLADPDVVIRLHAIAALKHFNSNQVYRQLLDLQSRSPALPIALQQGLQEALQNWVPPLAVDPTGPDWSNQTDAN